MALFYDRDYGRRWESGYDRGFRGHSPWADVPGGYDFGPERERWSYDRGFRGRPGRPGMWSGERYDADYRHRRQTSYGDPYNDRGAHTPFRLSRGAYRGADQRDYGWEADYDRDYSANPMGYDPYDEPVGRRGPRYGGWWRYDRNFRRY